ncbi:craniofacial development protein 2-like [Aphis craccivora]|uniref:Craniofacial development protein 2-like n=1 Tax=Aphis craccivora TaxID=307492 RepID=A0A6G0Y4F2_APHCR|nr:craniofacial development protein 2-like [Aphis craccivora]
MPVKTKLGCINNIGEDINNKQEEFIENEQNLNPAMKGPEITKNEFNRALRDLSNKKSTEIDDIPSEILKNLDGKTEKDLFEIIKKCYEEGSILEDFIKSKTITLPKKGNATDCYTSEPLLSCFTLQR